MYYSDGIVYSDGQQVATTDEYIAAAETIATASRPSRIPNGCPWEVFAITQDGECNGPAPTMFVQLQVSKEGMIAGTFQNTAAGTSQPIEGMVDKNSQRQPG